MTQGIVTYICSDIHMLRTDSDSQNLRLAHYNLFTFGNYNKFNDQVFSFLFF